MLKNVNYLLTTHDINKMPNDSLKEFVVVGKSNVGKSTFINTITNNKKLAHTSSKPGKTKAISFFDVDKKYRLVDIPGYGYAKVSKQQKVIFGKMIEEYFSKRENIYKVILLLDMRRELSSDDKEMINYFIYNEIPFNVIGTKSDKVNQSQKHKFMKNIHEELGTTPITFSSLSKKGLKEVLQIFDYIEN